jgi:hypothetical protein
MEVVSVKVRTFDFGVVLGTGSFPAAAPLGGARQEGTKGTKGTKEQKRNKGVGSLFREYSPLSSPQRPYGGEGDAIFEIGTEDGED